MGKAAKMKTRNFLISVILGITIILPNFVFSKNKVKKNPDLNILLITIDTIRADRVGYAGYDIETPRLDSLAYKGARFVNAVCQVPLTLPSHASILTGTNPPYHQIKGNGPYYVSEELTILAEILKNHGYSTSAFVGAYVLDSEFGLNQGFDHYDDDFITPEYLVKHEPQRLAEKVFSSVEKWLGKNHDRKFFAWVHYYDPHDPYTPPPPFDIKYETRPYEGEIAYTDIYVGKLIQSLKDKGIYQKTLIIVVGDHGEDLFDHMEPTHGIFLYDTTLKVPLIFHSPDVIPEGIKINDQVRTIDIFPTILDFIKIDIPKYCQGGSLIPLLEGKKIKKIKEAYAETYYPLISYGWSGLKSIRTAEWKYVQAPQPELYDLERDPAEKENVFAKRNKIALELGNKLKKLEKQISSGRKPVTRELTPEDQEKLRALGYVGGTVPSDGAERKRPDPKDKIFLLEGISKGKLAIKEGNVAEGERLLIDMMKQDPENAMIHHALGEMYQKKGEWDKAIKEFQDILKINPTEVDSYYMLAKNYYGKGMIEESIKTSEAALDLHPQHLKTLLFLSSLYKSQGKIDQSLEYFKKAVEAVPSKLKIRLEYAQSLTMARKYEKAIEEYEYLLKKIPDNPMIYNNLGLIHYFKGHYDQAVEYLSTEVKLHSNLNSYFILGLACGELKRYPEAVNYLEKFLSQSSVIDSSIREKAEQALASFRSKIK